MFGLYLLQEKIKRARRGNMMTTLSIIRQPHEEGSERLILDKKEGTEKDPLDEK